MAITAVTTIFGNVIQFDKPVGDNISHYRVFRRNDATTPSDTDFIGEVASSAKPSYLDLFTDLSNRDVFRYYIKTVTYGGKSSVMSRMISATTTEILNIGSTSTLTVNISGVNVNIDSVATAADTQTKTWTTTADFDEGTVVGLSTDSNQLTLDPTTAAGTWAVGGVLSTGRRYPIGFGAAQATSICAGGYVSTGEGSLTSEEYGGAAWGGGGNLNTSRYAGAGAGTLTAGLIFGGLSAGNTTELYDGTTWTTDAAFNSNRHYLAGLGLSTNAFGVGGYSNGTALLTTEQYGGIAWSISSNLPVGKYGHAGAGLVEAALVFGGAGNLDTSYEYDGTSWAAGGTLANGRGYMAGFGLQTLAVCVGGYTAAVTGTTEEYNGTGWTAGGALNTARYGMGGGGTKGNGLCFGGLPTASMTVTEEYSGGIAASGTWTLDFDTTATSSFGDVDLTEAGGGTVKLRCKSASTQAGLGGAAWVPAIGGYYTIFPVDNTAADSRWLRVEVAISGGSTVSDVTQDYTPTAVGKTAFGGEVINIGTAGSTVTIVGHNGFITTYETAAYTILSSDVTVLGNGTAIYTLPSAVGANGKRYWIKNIGTKSLTVTGDGAETIDETGSITLTRHEVITVVSDNTEWWII